ncbi:unnamed protein product [Linum tenue]|uniref:Mechanosensitive ion channel protein n=1 Tax=Linum tenue TaxID=586396 RepID=A0AAV0GQI6_9ROSI|nr:unnamed protein product [Linum tenue]
METAAAVAEHVILTVDVDHHDQPNHTNKKTKQPPPPSPSSKTLHRLNFSKPRSRFSEPNTPTARTYITHLSSDESESEEDEDFDPADDGDPKRRRSRKYSRFIKLKATKRAWTEFSFFLILASFLIYSLTFTPLKHKTEFGIEIWKWCLMVLVLFSGRLVSGWAVGFLVFLIERNFMLKEKVVYFVYGLRRSFQNCAWLALALLAWTVIMFGDTDDEKNAAVLKKLFRGLVAVLIGATLWLIKILLVKVLASSFHVTTYFDRMKESVFHHYILDALSGPPLEVAVVEAGRRRRGSISSGGGPRRIDMERLKKLSMERRASALSVKRLVNYIKSSGLSTISTAVDGFGQSEEIHSEVEARSCGRRIFRNVAKPAAKYIEEEDLLRFLTTEEVHTIFPLFEGALETGRITKSSFKNWVVRAYVERKALAHSLNDTKTAVHQLHKLASAVAMVVIVVMSLLVMGLATTKVLLVVTSQLLLVGFMFQNTCKTMFESIIFVFVMHPFDVGDRCVIDGVQMIVEEMNILTTVFLRYDMEKIYYPNSVLISKPISNFRRSPDMGDSVDFTIDVSTSIDDFNALKKAIQTYIESKPKHWNPKHSVVVKEIENVDKMKLTLAVQHTMNHQNYGEKSSRRSELVFELKKIFDNLGIKYHLLPQQVHLTQLTNTSNSGRLSI